MISNPWYDSNISSISMRQILIVHNIGCVYHNVTAHYCQLITMTEAKSNYIFSTNF